MRPASTSRSGSDLLCRSGLYCRIPALLDDVDLSSIYYAPRPTLFGSPVVIYLPGNLGRVIEPSKYPPLPALAFAANATAVCIHYRTSAEQPYPTPIHDVLAGYDWVQRHLARRSVDSNNVNDAQCSTEAANIGVCGEGPVGGSLASMLALTECRPTSGAIKAAAIGNPILDWTSLFPVGDNGVPLAGLSPEKTVSTSASNVAPQRLATQHDQTLSEAGLLHLRSRLFTRPETYFDPFASPLLFFRTPASDIPDDTALHQLLDRPAANNSPTTRNGCSAHAKKRRAHRKYPPNGSGLRLPYMRFEVGIDNAFKAQGKEMVEVLKKSMRYWEDESYGATNREALSKRIQLVEREGLGWWNEKEIRELGSWFGDYLRR